MGSDLSDIGVLGARPVGGDAIRGSIEVEPETPVKAPVVIVNGREAGTGKFAKGNNIRPANPKGGRPRKMDSRPILEAITDEFAPDEIRVMLRKAYDTALKMEDWKGQIEVVRFIANYAIGKPVQRSINANVDVNDFIDLFKGRGEDDGEDDNAAD